MSEDLTEQEQTQCVPKYWCKAKGFAYLKGEFGQTATASGSASATSNDPLGAIKIARDLAMLEAFNAISEVLKHRGPVLTVKIDVCSMECVVYDCLCETSEWCEEENHHKLLGAYNGSNMHTNNHN